MLQILKDEATRERYDYAIAHPEEVHRRNLLIQIIMLINCGLREMTCLWGILCLLITLR